MGREQKAGTSGERCVQRDNDKNEKSKSQREKGVCTEREDEKLVCERCVLVLHAGGTCLEFDSFRRLWLLNKCTVLEQRTADPVHHREVCVHSQD